MILIDIFYLKVFNNNELIQVLCNGIPPREKYPETVRHFCLSLHYYSPRAYAYVRKEFNNNLPHPHTIKSWYANSDVKGEAGLQKECLSRLQRICQDYEEENKCRLMCSLVFDEINIRKQIYWCWHKSDFVGFVNYGQDPESQKNSIAKQAIVFILNGVNANFEFPLAYFFIDTLNKTQRRDLLSDIIKAVTECQVKITNITFDGYSSNVPMCELLGANLDVESDAFQPYFFNPINDEKIYIIMDPCHAEKLLRNTLANKKTIFDDHNEKIQWRFFESLYECSKRSQLRTHKLTKQHIQWTRTAMNVRIASETLSDSVANSMQYLLDSNHPDFIGSEPTIR